MTTIIRPPQLLLMSATVLLWLLLLSISSVEGLTIHAAPHGSEEHQLCGSASFPCALATALDMAVPHSTVLLASGVYRGGYHVTVPVRLIASANGTVILDGASRHRPLTFENVRAHVEGIGFRNGLGEGAGCVLVNLITGGVDGPNNFTRCAFSN